jgi:hypothetical protein
MKTRVFLHILTAVVLAASLLSAGRKDDREVDYEVPSVTLTLLTDKPVTIGDPVDLAVTVFHRRGDIVSFPESQDDFEPLLLRDFSSKKKKIGNGVAKTMALYRVSAFQTGDVTLDPLTIGVGEKKLSTEPLTFSVLSVLPADEEDRELRDIAPPIRARIKTLSLIVILLGAAAAFAAFILLKRFLIRPRQFPKTIVESETAFDPYGYSLSQLERIKQAHTSKQADTKKVYTTIAHSLKLFFGSMLSIQALEMTTSELKRYLKRHHTGYVQPNRLVNILHRSDMVKFAKDAPVHKQVEQDIDQSITIIKEAQSRTVSSVDEQGGVQLDDV